MYESAAVNASPLIFLSLIRRLDLLQLVCPKVTVPAPVADEIQQFGPADPTAEALATTTWLTREDTGGSDPVIRAWDLGPGEEAVIQWA